jgi:toxin ParE1/3/4
VTSKPIFAREKARWDIEGAVDYYFTTAGQGIALQFVDSLERVYWLISAYPASGSLRYAYELNLPGLRFRQLTNYPYLVFYIEGEHHVDVWRVLHAQRDIPAWMQESATGNG